MNLGERKLTENVLLEDYFETIEGKNVKNVDELLEALKFLEDELFTFYVSKAHHKIADWILEGYGNLDLSKRLRKNIEKKEIIKELEEALKKENSNLEKPRGIKIPIQKNKKEILLTLSKIE